MVSILSPESNCRGNPFLRTYKRILRVWKLDITLAVSAQEKARFGVLSFGAHCILSTFISKMDDQFRVENTHHLIQLHNSYSWWYVRTHQVCYKNLTKYRSLKRIIPTWGLAVRSVVVSDNSHSKLHISWLISHEIKANHFKSKQNNQNLWNKSNCSPFK